MHLILKIGISRDTECVNTVGFPKLGHIYSFTKICKLHEWPNRPYKWSFSTVILSKCCQIGSMCHQCAIKAVLQDKGFQVPSNEAANALETAEILTKWTTDCANEASCLEF